MIAQGYALIDLALSACAVLGLFFLHRHLTGPHEPDPLTRRFLFGVRVSLLLFAGRVLVAIGGGFFRPLVLIAAALVPLAVLLLTEGLLRRHAPGWLKVFAACGAILFAILALFPSGLMDPWRGWALLAFQLTVLMACGWLVATRDKDSLTTPENATAARLALSLVLLVPLIGADYAILWIDLPLQVSAIGVLVLCWLAMGLGSAAHNHAKVVAGLGALFAVALCLSGVITNAVDADNRSLVAIWCLLASVFLALGIAVEASRSSQERQSLSILRHMATAPRSDALTFLRALQSLPVVGGAALVEGDALVDLDQSVLDIIFATKPVLRRADPDFHDPAMAEHVAYLFDRYPASHIMQVADRPRVIIALDMPSLGLSSRTELEIDAVQRMAVLMNDKEHTIAD